MIPAATLIQLLAPVLYGAVQKQASASNPIAEGEARPSVSQFDLASLAAILASSQRPAGPTPLPEVKMPWAAGFISAVITVGFFALMGAISWLLISGQEPNAALLVGFGALLSWVTVIVAFYLGSSFGSRQKDARPTAEPTGAPIILPSPVEPTPPSVEPAPPAEPHEATPTPELTIQGKISTFGGPADHGSGDPAEGLALYEEAQASERPDLFLTVGPGLFRRLNPAAHYIAARWDYAKTPKAWLRSHKVKLTAKGKSVDLSPVDWGPHIDTGRALDISPGAAAALDLDTDDIATAKVPLPGSATLAQDRPGGPSWLARAVALRGLYERAGDADNPAILEMARICGGQISAAYKHDSIAWCALFANYCLIASKYPGNDSLWALDFGKYGRRLTGPTVGSIASMKRDGGGHVVFVRGRTSAGKIVGIGGNMSDAVRDDVYDPGRIVSYNYPEDAPLPLNVGVSMNDLSALPIIEPVTLEKREVGLSA